MRVKVILTGFIVDLKDVPDDTGVEIIEGILIGKRFNSTDLKSLNNNENFNC